MRLASQEHGQQAAVVGTNRGRFKETDQLVVLLGAFLTVAAFPVFWVGLFAARTGEPFQFASEVAGRWELVRGISQAQLLNNTVVSQFTQQSVVVGDQCFAAGRTLSCTTK
ncbi:MAG: hypothetical protein HY315_07960 [Acidobacteria bacterium]|nr:hypothetical protein [Acidobacteriota bacterium]